MLLTLLKGKIHRATVTLCDLDQDDSILIDEGLMQGAGILPYEKIDVLNICNGSRFATHAMPAPPNSGVIGVNGPAARLAQKGDLLIIIAYVGLGGSKLQEFLPKVQLVNRENRPFP